MKPITVKKTMAFEVYPEDAPNTLAWDEAVQWKKKF